MQAERAKSHERGGKQHAMGMQDQGKSVRSEKLAWGGGSQRRWRFQHRARQREEFQAAETAKAWAQKCAKSMGNDLVWWRTCHGWEGGSLVDWVIPHRVSDVLLGFGNVSSGYEKHGRNFVWLFMCGWACFSKLFY